MPGGGTGRPRRTSRASAKARVLPTSAGRGALHQQARATESLKPGRLCGRWSSEWRKEALRRRQRSAAGTKLRHHVGDEPLKGKVALGVVAIGDRHVPAVTVATPRRRDRRLRRLEGKRSIRACRGGWLRTLSGASPSFSVSAIKRETLISTSRQTSRCEPLGADGGGGTSSKSRNRWEPMR